MAHGQQPAAGITVPAQPQGSSQHSPRQSPLCASHCTTWECSHKQLLASEMLPSENSHCLLAALNNIFLTLLKGLACIMHVVIISFSANNCCALIVTKAW